MEQGNKGVGDEGVPGLTAQGAIHMLWLLAPVIGLPMPAMREPLRQRAMRWGAGVLEAVAKRLPGPDGAQLGWLAWMLRDLQEHERWEAHKAAAREYMRLARQVLSARMAEDKKRGAAS